MDDYDLGWLLQRTDEPYLRISLQNEFEERHIYKRKRRASVYIIPHLLITSKAPPLGGATA